MAKLNVAARRACGLSVACAVLASAACDDSPAGNRAPAPPSPSLGVVVGTISPSGVTFAPVAASSAENPGAAIYGGQNVTINVHSVSFSIDSTTTPGTKVWSIGVGLRNLLSYPIGANQGAASSQDTSGIFVYVSSSPVVTLPASCPGCKVTVTNAMGSRAFTGFTPQQYFWYYSRLQAVQPTPGSDTTQNDPVWKFTGQKTVTGFTFVLLVSAAWPPPQDAAWLVSYTASTDSNPNTQSDPRWKNFKFTSTLGTTGWTTSGLTLSAASGADIFDTRNDSLGKDEQAFFDIRMQANNADNGIPENFFGFFDPEYFVIGVAKDKVGFVNRNVFGVWVFVGTTYSFPSGDATSLHHYRLRKYGRDSTRLCVDNTPALLITGSPVPLSSGPAGVTEMFGTAAQAATSGSLWTTAPYTLGAAGSGCPS